MTGRLEPFATGLDGVDAVDSEAAAVDAIESRAGTALGDLQTAAESVAASGTVTDVRTLYDLSWVAPGALAGSLPELAGGLDDPDARPYAAGAFANVAESAAGAEWAVPTASLVERVRTGDDDQCRRALLAVGRIARVNARVVRDAQPVLWETVDRPERPAREAALEGLCHLTTDCRPDGARLPAVVALLDHDRPRQRALAMGTLANVAYWTTDGDDFRTVLSAAERCLRDDDPTVRRFATQVFESKHPDVWTDHLGRDPGDEVVAFARAVLECQDDTTGVVAERIDGILPDFVRYYPHPFVPLADTDSDLVRSVVPELRDALDQWDDESERVVWSILDALDAVPDGYDGPPDPEDEGESADSVDPEDEGESTDSVDPEDEAETGSESDEDRGLRDWLPF